MRRAVISCDAPQLDSHPSSRRSAQAMYRTISREKSTVRERLLLREGVTLVEMLVTVAVSMIMIIAIVKLFQTTRDGVSSSRSIIEMSGQLRSAAQRLQLDLDGITVPVRPWPEQAGAYGYFEINEGPLYDYSNQTTDFGDLATVVGDWDDRISFTSRNQDEPFTGRCIINGVPTTIQSEYAEIIWWARRVPGTNRITLHRRALLIRPDLGQIGVNFNENDVSVAPNGEANSLQSLMRRENRFAHVGAFPHAMAASENIVIQTGDHIGNDLVLNDVLAFDVKVYDPMAQVRLNNGIPCSPSDPAWTGGAAAGVGTYVDLYYGLYAPPPQATNFSVVPQFRTGATNANGLAQYGNHACYDTWTTSYERDGIQQSGTVADPGNSGTEYLDGRYGSQLRETTPPYPFPLRGVKISIRMTDPSSGQVRQSSVVADFIPE